MDPMYVTTQLARLLTVAFAETVGATKPDGTALVAIMNGECNR